jgi:hypothetical protein
MNPFELLWTWIVNLGKSIVDVYQILPAPVQTIVNVIGIVAVAIVVLKGLFGKGSS